MTGFPILSIMLAIPAIAAVVCLFVGAQGARDRAGRDLIDLALGIWLWANFDQSAAGCPVAVHRACPPVRHSASISPGRWASTASR
jgi:NADH:ubiquinone oxidoreductase subunit 4 (subunit M)